jgi:hypothetical protein
VRRAQAKASSNVSPWRTISAPWRSVWLTFTEGVGAGMTMVAGMPRRRA